MNEYTAYEVPRGQTPLRFTQNDKVILELNTLPLSSRTVEEILGDHAIEFACLASYNRSVIRRGPKRYESQLVVDYLDFLDASTHKAGSLAAGQMRRHIELMAPTTKSAK